MSLHIYKCCIIILQGVELQEEVLLEERPKEASTRVLLQMISSFEAFKKNTCCLVGVGKS